MSSKKQRVKRRIRRTISGTASPNSIATSSDSSAKPRRRRRASAIDASLGQSKGKVGKKSVSSRLSLSAAQVQSLMQPSMIRTQSQPYTGSGSARPILLNAAVRRRIKNERRRSMHIARPLKKSTLRAGIKVRARSLSESTVPSWQFRAFRPAQALRESSSSSTSSSAAARVRRGRSTTAKARERLQALEADVALFVSACVESLRAEWRQLHERHDLRIAKPGFANDSDFLFYDEAIQEATAARLVALIGSAKPPERFYSTMVYAHHFFCSSDEFLAQLIAIFRRAPSAIVVDAYNAKRGMTPADAQRVSQLSVLLFLHEWLDSAAGEFIDGASPCAQRLARFAAALESQAGDEEATRWSRMLTTMMAHVRARRQCVVADSLFDLKPFAKNNYSSLLDVPPNELAEQWVLLDATLLRNIELKELRQGSWTKPGAARNIDKMSQWVDERSFWVASEIVSEANISKRAATLSYFLSVAEALLNLNDFMALRSIYLALNLTAIARLKNTWARLGDTERVVWRTVSALMSYDANSRVYRLFVDGREPPIVLCPTVFLRDFLKQHETIALNADKRWQYAQLERWAREMQLLRNAQREQYTELEPRRQILQWLLHRAHIVSGEQLRSISLSIESAQEAPAADASRFSKIVSRIQARSLPASPAASPLRSATASALASSSPTSPAAPSACERCGKRAPTGTVEVTDNSRLHVCNKCYKELRKLTGPSLRFTPLLSNDSPNRSRTGLLKSLRRRASKTREKPKAEAIKPKLTPIKNEKIVENDDNSSSESCSSTSSDSDSNTNSSMNNSDSDGGFNAIAKTSDAFAVLGVQTRALGRSPRKSDSKLIPFLPRSKREVKRQSLVLEIDSLSSKKFGK